MEVTSLTRPFSLFGLLGATLQDSLGFEIPLVPKICSIPLLITGVPYALLATLTSPSFGGEGRGREGLVYTACMSMRRLVYFG
jgi:hypothetical protein